MNYKEEILKATDMLAEDKRVLFIGQNVIYGGPVAIQESLENVPLTKIIELPVAEEMQMGLSIGLALEGYIPVSIYPRMDFLILAINQLVNHLDKIRMMSVGRYCPKVIIRTFIGSRKPLDAGLQHTQDHSEALRHMLHEIEIETLIDAEDILPAYKIALANNKSTILIEMSELARR